MVRSFIVKLEEVKKPEDYTPPAGLPPTYHVPDNFEITLRADLIDEETESGRDLYFYIDAHDFFNFGSLLEEMDPTAFQIVGVETAPYTGYIGWRSGGSQ